MSPDPRRELRRLQESPAFRTYEDVRRMCLSYSMMDSKLAELRDAVRRAGAQPPAHWRPGVADREAVEVCQLLADFLSRMYCCKNLAGLCAGRHGLDAESKALKRSTLGFEALVMVNLRNYVVHVDMLPLEIGDGGSVAFTRRCRSDGIWSAAQRRYLGDVDVGSFLAAYSESLSAFYAGFFPLLVSATRDSLGECRQEMRAINRRAGYEVVRFDPMPGMRA